MRCLRHARVAGKRLEDSSFATPISHTRRGNGGVSVHERTSGRIELTDATAHVIESDAEAIEVATAYAASIAGTASERDRAGKVPVEALAALDASGLLGVTVPREHGGADVSMVTLAEVIRLIAAADPAIAQTPQAHFLLVDVLAVLGDDHQRQTMFAEILAGARIGSAVAERGGTHAQDLRTRVQAGDDGLRLDGRKYYCTGVISGRWAAVTALDHNDQVVLVLVKRDAEGLSVDEDWNVMGQRATISGSTTLENVHVDPRLVIPYQAPFERPQQLGARTQLVHAAIEVGIASGALEDAGRFVRDKARPFFEAVRAGWAETASDDPHTIYRYGQLATRVQAARALLSWAAEVQQQIGRVPADAEAAARGSLAIAQAKAFGSEIAGEVASEMFALAGASAADERYNLSRHWRNARTHASHDPVDWKYHHLGNFMLNGTAPPNHGQL
jgi:SfnB family sulfur acquisition oxidoreductase